MTRWLITGAGGMLGHDLAELLRADATQEITALNRAGLDISDPQQVRDAVLGHDVVVNAAAWTDVDGSETQEAAATAINGGAVQGLADACRQTGAILIHLSTDYVFDGQATSPYREDAPTKPVNAYGRSKLAGEQAVLATLPETGYVVRTSWLYGANGRNFVQTMLDLASKRETLSVVNDQHGQPTWTKALAAQIAELAASARQRQAPAGVYHGTAGGQTTWFELAVQAFRHAGLDPARLTPVSSNEFVRPAARPAYSVLGHDRWRQAGLAAQPGWDIQLKAAFEAEVFRKVNP
ncbi:NAD(P)-dependent oxidoreductase [Rhizocola hellebori]|uniref:dTDP-4-dehydrorhamnose reductase n=1 Tax=Rhizocola hellebori TaxID=1392758 RepID=A0A8J3QEY1_9ACTN|nr:NAD(P)-dependent oxidoreductase [Rhizocola hellebori]